MSTSQRWQAGRQTALATRSRSTCRRTVRSALCGKHVIAALYETPRIPCTAAAGGCRPLHQAFLLRRLGSVTALAADLDLPVAAARLFKVLSDPTRLALLRRLGRGPASVSELVAAVGDPPQSRVSNHLACLRWCELVTSEKIGRQVIYRLADARVLPLLDSATVVAATHDDQLVRCSRLGPEWI